MSKLKSRKFWIAVASMLASVGAAIAGLTTDNEMVTVVGAICTIVSGAIYSFCESYIDGVRATYTGNVPDCEEEDTEDAAVLYEEEEDE